MKRMYLSLMGMLCLLCSVTLAQSVRRAAFPLNGKADLKPLKKALAGTQIVGMGEATHGSHECFTMKQQVFEFLVEEMGYTVFAIEDGIYGANLINNYILTGQGDPRQILKDEFHSVWQVKELTDLIEWMKDYNTQHTRKLTFAGFDSQQMDSYVRALRTFETQYKTNIFTPFTDYDGEGVDSINDAMHMASRIVDSVLHSLPPKPAIVPDTAWEQATWMINNISAALHQFNKKDFLQALNTRDSMMALNIDHLIKLHPGEKMMLWAHNGHIGRQHIFTVEFNTMGANLKRHYGESYTCIGFATSTGTYRAAIEKSENMKTDNVLIPAGPGTAEYILHQTGIPVFLLPLKKVPVEGKFRSIGVFASEYQFPEKPGKLGDLFDWLIYIDKTTAAVSL
ncbi:erythromycin esterase family protein [Chitinophaga niabensis]|uniref:Erythromycin esterase n=1 Tax=Chitinophaga niabensis TaxID=536979 RepID=A0A1N6E770_9BACT|nr:erythromycin esterase family protein [Chitinophaga niabensis]SIN78860.1 erythromycin esterase [Chitinophaga niabensis]